MENKNFPYGENDGKWNDLWHSNRFSMTDMIVREFLWKCVRFFSLAKKRILDL